MKKLIKKITALMSATAVMGTLAVMPAGAEAETAVNLLSSAVLKKADSNNGTDVSSTFNLLTDGDYTNNQNINRKGSTNTYYAVYEVNAVITSITSYYTNTTNGGKVIVYGSNDGNLALLTTPPSSDLGWDGDGKNDKVGGFKNTYKLTYLGKASGGTEENINVGEKNVYKKSTAVDDTTGYKYLVLLLDGWTNTNVSEIEITGTKKLDPLTTDNVIWAQDITDRNGNHQGSSGTVEKNDFGKFKNVNGEVKIFFPNAVNNGKIGEYTRISGIDNGSNSVWKGYITAEITAESDGKYDVYILGNTNAANRAIEVTNSTTNSSASADSNVTECSTSNYLKVMKAVNIEFAKGTNKLKLQAPSGSSAPNFIAMYITKAVSEETEMTQAMFGGTYNGEAVDGKEIVSGEETFSVWKGEIDGASSGKVEVTAITATGEKRTTTGSLATITGNAATEFFVIINKAATALSGVTYKTVD